MKMFLLKTWTLRGTAPHVFGVINAADEGEAMAKLGLEDRDGQMAFKEEGQAKKVLGEDFAFGLNVKVVTLRLEEIKNLAQHDLSRTTAGRDPDSFSC
ncbi:MAG: hypothetical protein AAB692_06310 [Patescibacteria group bacterium]